MIPRPIQHLIGTRFNFANAAWLCVLSALALSIIGLYAIDLGASDRPPAPDTLVTFRGTVLRQAVFVAIGLLAAGLVALPHSRFIRLLAWPLLAVVIALLVFLILPFVPASIVTPRNGARAWINLGPIDFQPAELAKIAYILCLADYLRLRENHRTVLGLIPPAVISAVPVGLIMLQPDLGTAMLFAPVAFAVLVAAGARLKHLALVVLIAILAAPAAFPLLKPHQKARIVGLVRMMHDPRQGADDINYQSQTAQRLAAAGGVSGMTDTQSRTLIRFNRLPERHNDMILAVIINRFGLVGGLVVAALYVVWFTGCYLSAAMCKDGFGRLVIIGIAAVTAAQALVNAGMTLGVLPIIGVTLPFISYGGSSMLAAWVMTGLVVGIALRRDQRFARETFEFDERPYSPGRVSTAHRGAVGGLKGG